MRIGLIFLPLLVGAQTVDEAQRWLDRPLLDPRQSQMEVQLYTAARVPLLPVFATAPEWQRYAKNLRAEILDKVVFRGEARQWRQAPLRVEWTDTLPGTGYKIRKFRLQVLPGMWAPGVLYEPERIEGKTPVVLNVNGHERTGISTPYIQIRCMNLARRGMYAINTEWLGKGQLDVPGLNHYRMQQLDLTGTSGLAVFYLLMERTVDLGLSLANVDPERLAVTGLSGGGWQTTVISALDERVKLAVPVAGHSSFVTRTQQPGYDLGDSEQTPTDLATLADYTHLSAMVAPRPLMLIYNEKDNCCFRAEYAPAPMVQAVRSVYALNGALDRFAYSVNYAEGHNYNQDSREELYRFLERIFFPNRKGTPEHEPPSPDVLTAAQLASPLPEDNATFTTLARDLAKDLPRPGGTREGLASVVKARSYAVDARLVDKQEGTEWWRLRMDGAWSVPAVVVGSESARRQVILLADQGRRSVAVRVAELAKDGVAVLAIDPFYLGESKIATRDHLFAILVAAVGDRPLGVQVSQVMAAAKWLAARHSGASVEIEAHGRKSSLIALIAQALDEKSIAAITAHDSFRSLQQILEEDLTVDKQPELFCFGLLEHFDIPQIAELARSGGRRVDLR